jgi:rhodanese-related sulfurtransferase
MKLLFGILMAALAFAQDAPKKLTADELKETIAKTEGLFLLDVREPRELEEFGTLKNSKNIPVGQVEQRLSEVPKDRKVVVFCQRGARAAKAAEVLKKNGYQVTGVAGMIGWKEKKYDVVYPPKQ